jgi:putative nucleotidyltransferase with HDIG domain
MDLAHPSIADHQHRVAYISIRVGRSLGLPGPELVDLFRAAVFHDIGLIRVENRIAAIHDDDVEKTAWHGCVGYELLRDNALFRVAAETIRFHHIPWAYGRGAEHQGHRVPFASHIVSLADKVERLLDRERPVLDQAEDLTREVTSKAEETFHPACVDAFREVSQNPSFWFDLACDRIYNVLLGTIDLPLVCVDEETITPIAKIFAQIVDAASQWTATHSAGVAATAVGLAERLKLSPREVHLMRAAGYLHDVGKLTIPSSILDKEGSLTREERNIIMGHTYHTFRILDTIGGMPQVCEWAAFHHERLDGMGYPFRHRGADLTLGARIMAVADVFTALTEPRPYRDGMERSKVLSILREMAEKRGIDGDVVSTLAEDYDAIDALRREEQVEYGEKQRRLADIIGSCQMVAA